MYSKDKRSQKINEKLARKRKKAYSKKITQPKIVVRANKYKEGV